jgi:cysteine-rich repeat protein
MALLCSYPTPSSAHTQPIPLERWGPFAAGTLECIRSMSRAAHTCYDDVLVIEQRCRNAVAQGGTCDQDQLEADVEAATRPMRATLTTVCDSGELTEVGYIGFFDAEADLFNACVTQARGALSATYTPSLTGVPPAAVAQCMTATAEYGRKVMRYILGREVPVFERIASRYVPCPTGTPTQTPSECGGYTKEERDAFIRAIETELSATRPRWVTGLTAACPDFATIYGRTADSFLRTLKQRTDCVLSKTYVNTGVSCLGQVCGNGIQEADEECDDGNRVETDTCLSNCKLPTATP